MSTIDQSLVNSVAMALRRLPWSCNNIDIARAAIAAVRENECCSVCSAPVQPPTLCDSCAAKIARNEVPAKETP